MLHETDYLKKIYGDLPTLMIKRGLSLTDYTVLSTYKDDSFLMDCKLLCWCPGMKIIRKHMQLTIYKHPVFNIVIHDTKLKQIFIHSRMINTYATHKKLKNGNK